MESARRTAALAWVTVAVWALMAVVVYRVGYRAEAGTRAGAEPEMAGLTFAFPFALLSFLGVLWAVDVSGRDRRRRLIGLRRMTVSALVVAVLVVAWLGASTNGGYPVGRAVSASGSIVAALFLPLIATWSSYRRSGAAADQPEPTP